MDTFVCFGYCVAFILMTVAFAGVIILTRIETEDQLRTWMITFVLAIAIYVLVFEPIRLLLVWLCSGCFSKALHGKAPKDEEGEILEPHDNDEEPIEAAQ
jgi:hypothetical protein